MADVSQVKKLAFQGFRVIRADEFTNVILEWNGEGWNTIRRLKPVNRPRRRLREAMTKMLRDPLTVRG